MPRPARFTNDQIVSCTERVVAEYGPAGASIARISRALGAPTGSIYHRFNSRNVLLGEVWLRTIAAFQEGVLQRLSQPDAKSAGLAAVLYVPAWVRDNPERARILLLYRSGDFFEREWPESMSARANALRRQLIDNLHDFGERLFGNVDSDKLQILSFALAEAPLAAVRRYVEAGDPPPPIVDELIEASYGASLSMARIER